MSKMWRFLNLIVVATTLVFSPGTDGAADKEKKRDTLYNDIYRDIDDMGYCVRLTNANQSIGCATGPNGNTGTVYLIESQRDIDWVLSEGSIPPYVPLINQKQFYNRTFMMVLKDGAAAGRISGVIADFLTSTNDYQQDGGESPARQCPNQGFGGIGSTCNPTWNPKGNSLAFDRFDFPIFGVRDPTQLGALKNCSILFNQKNSSSYPACQVRMRAFMSASINTPTCMRKNSHVILSSGFCDPLGNPSFWGSLFSPTNFDQSQAVVMATAKMDSSAFFHQLAFGANNDASGIVALLGALEALGKLKRDRKISENSISKPIIFVFFNGEEWDYIGSSRMVYNLLKNCKKDSKKKKCEVGDGEVPISRFLGLNRIESFLELSQIGLPGENGTLFGHKPNNTNATKLFNTLTTYSSAISSAPDGQQLPPSSLLQFLNESNVIGGVVLADHPGSYKNRFYGGAFDDENNLHLDADQTTSSHLTSVSTTVAKTLLKLAGANDSVIDMVEANETTISTLLHCFVQKTNCTLFKSLSTSDDADKLPKGKPGPRYISVGGSTPSAVTLIRKLAIYYSGIAATGTKQDDCTNGPVSESKSGKSDYLKTMVWNRGEKLCRYGYVYKTDAKSPAFLLKEYDSSKYSTWAESRWDVDPTLSFYVASSDYIENVTLGVGVMMFVLSFFGTWYGMRRMNSLSGGEYTVQ